MGAGSDQQDATKGLNMNSLNGINGLDQLQGILAGTQKLDGSDPKAALAGLDLATKFPGLESSGQQGQLNQLNLADHQ